MNEGLARLRSHGASGCVLIGNPNHYSRFGFVGNCDTMYESIGAPYVRALSFRAASPTGEVRFAPAFYSFAKCGQMPPLECILFARAPKADLRAATALFAQHPLDRPLKSKTVLERL